MTEKQDQGNKIVGSGKRQPSEQTSPALTDVAGILVRRWTRMALLRGLAAAAIGAYVLLERTPKSVSAPSFVKPVGLLLAGAVAATALLQLTYPTSRRLAVASVWVDAVVASALLWLYAFDPGRYLFTLVLPVLAGAALILGLAGGIRVLLLVSMSYVFVETVAAPHYGVSVDIGAVLVRLGAATAIVAIVGVLGRMLERERRFLLALLETIPDAVLVTSEGGTIQLVNDGTERLFGYVRGELLGRNIEVLMPGDVRTPHHEQYLAYLQHPTPRAMAHGRACKALSRSGEPVPVECSLNCVETDRGVFAMAIARDVTERLRMEKELQSTSEWLRALFDAAPTAIIGLDRQMRVASWNPAAERIFGWSAQEAVGGRPPIVGEDQAEEFAALAGTVLKGGSLTGVEILRRRKDGSEIAVSLSAAPVRDEEGNITGIMAVMEDVTERKRATQALVESEERFRRLLETASNGILVADVEGRITLVNAEIVRMFGYSREELLGNRVEMLVPDGLSTIHRARMEEYLAQPRTRKMGSDLDLVARRKDGSEFPVEIGLSSTQTERGIFVTAIISDITERRRAQQELRENMALLRKSDEGRRVLLSRLVDAQEEERRRIAEDIHDDSIQMIVAVGMRLSTLARRIVDPELTAAVGSLEEIVDTAITRLRQLVFGLRPRVLDTEGLAVALRASMDQMAPPELEWHLDNRLVTEPTPDDRVILFRIAQEALRNVRKHSHAKRVDLLLEPRDDGCLVRIRDDGVGFSPNEVDLSQLEHIGLSTMRERAEMAGGWLRIDAQPGEGATVEFWLPGNTTGTSSVAGS